MDFPTLIAQFFLIWDQPITLALVFLTGFWFLDRPTWGVAIMLSGFSMILNPALKEYFQMLRPGDSGEFGFPSGHFSGAMCFYGWLFLRYNQASIRIVIAILLAGIGYGVVHMGYHYPRDVAGAFGFCSIILGATYALMNRSAFVRKPHLLGCALVGIGIFPLLYMYMHTGIQKHSLVGFATIIAVMLVWWRFFPTEQKPSR